VNKDQNWSRIIGMKGLPGFGWRCAKDWCGLMDRVLGIGFKPYPMDIGGSDDRFLRRIGGVISVG
jgi:hypothetical protein